MKKEIDIFLYHGLLFAVIPRNELTGRITDSQKRSKLVALIGPRQCGKTTLAMEFISPESPNYFDLEDGTHNGAEIDLVMVKNGRLLGLECKLADVPRLTPSVRIA